MEPFIVVNRIIDLNNQYEDIYKTTQAESHSTGSYGEWIYYFVNIEQDCALSRLYYGANESYIIPSNTYYLIDNWDTGEGTLTNTCFFVGKGTTVRTLYLGQIPNDGTSIRLINLNVRAYYE